VSAVSKRNTLIGAVIAVAIIIVLLEVSAPDGAELFRTRGCIGCHSFKGRGGAIGPDLTAVTHRRSRGWIRDQIKNPRLHNPNTVMPSFSQLSWREVNALINYLNS